MKNSIYAIFVAVIICSSPFAMCEDGPSRHPHVASVYPLGATKTYRILVPKEFFDGAPPTPAAMQFGRGKPKREEDFNVFYVKVSVVTNKVPRNDRGVIVLMRVDVVDASNSPLREGVYYFYAEEHSNGIRIASNGSSSSTEGDGYYLGQNYMGLILPFEGGRPPALAPRSGGPDGYINRTKLGHEYRTQEATNNTAAVLQEMTRFEDRNPDTPGVRKAKWMGAEVQELVRAPHTKTLYREKQKWAKADDWLWEEMERFDTAGNIMMRCKLVSQTPGTEQKEPVKTRSKDEDSKQLPP